MSETKTPEPALLPCPLCGASDVELNHQTVGDDGEPDSDIWHVNCSVCFLTSGPEYDGEMAIAAWNHRAPAPMTTPSPTGADDVTERMRKLADAIERSNLSPCLHALPDELRSFATAFEALTKERDSFRRDFLAVRDQRAADVCRFDDARNERASLGGQVQYLKDQVAAQVDIAKAAVWDIDEVKAERDALREEVRQIARTRTADYAEYRAEVDALRAKLEAVTDDLEQIEEAMPENANGTDVVDFCKRMFAGDEALREKLAEAERQLSEVAAEWDAHAAIYKQAEARAVALAKERDEAITSLRLTQKARADDIGRLQQKCSDWGTYWRASDAHGVKLSVEQSVELLQDALGVEVEILAAGRSP